MFAFRGKPRKSWLVAFVLVASVFAFSLVATAAEAKVLKLSHTGAENHHYQQGALMFKDLVEERSSGDLVVEVYPLDQLGTQRESVEGAQLGTVDLVLTSDVQLSSFEPSFGALNLPYLFTNYAEVTKVLDGKVGEMLSDRLSEKGLIVLGYWENGFRDITNNVRPIAKPEDLVGLKIRTPSGRVFVDSFNAWGANATPMDLSEVYSALQVGTLDGQENPPAHALDRKFYEVQDYYSITHHIHVAEPLVISKITWGGLSDGDKKILKDAAVEVAVWMRDHVKGINDKQIEELKTEYGMQINEADVPAFKKGSEPVYEKYEDRFGDIIEAIRNTLES
jgi:tripartite ATP-independent transporter DctP family solute receptor